MTTELEELEEQRQENRKERLRFIRFYAAWLKKTPNKVWSKQHSEFIDSVIDRDLVNSVTRTRASGSAFRVEEEKPDFRTSTRKTRKKD